MVVEQKLIRMRYLRITGLYIKLIDVRNHAVLGTVRLSLCLSVTGAYIDSGTTMSSCWSDAHRMDH